MTINQYSIQRMMCGIAKDEWCIKCNIKYHIDKDIYKKIWHANNKHILISLCNQA